MVQWSFKLTNFTLRLVFFQKNNYFFSIDQSDFKTMISRVNTCTINIFKNYNCIKLYELNNTQNHVYLLDKYSVLYTCIHNLSGLVVKPLCVWACIPLSVEPTQWPTSFYFIPYYITSLSHLITLLRGHFWRTTCDLSGSRFTLEFFSTLSYLLVSLQVTFGEVIYLKFTCCFKLYVFNYFWGNIL